MYVAQSNLMSAIPLNQTSQIPQPGEIWRVSPLVQSPLQFSLEEQQPLYSEPALNFLQGGEGSRYVMVVTEAEQATEAEWQVVSVMVFSLEIQFLSPVDILISTAVSGLEHEVLAETWHIQEMLACNLANPVGRRVSRQVYDLLMAVGDYQQEPQQEPQQELINEQTLYEMQQLGLQIGTTSTATNTALQAFHQREKAWSDVLTVPLAAYRSYLKGVQRTEQVLQAAIAVEREFATKQQPIHLSQWFEELREAGWQAFSIWTARTDTLAIATRSPNLSENFPADSDEVAALIDQLKHETDEPQRRRIAKQLGESATGHTEAIQILVDLVRSTQNDETLWSAVESLRKLDPRNPAAGVCQVKLIDLGMQVSGQPVALAVALVQKTNRQVGVLLQVYPTENELYLPAHLKLVLMDETGQSLREVIARRSDVCIQLKFSGEPGEPFSVRIELGSASLTEDFVI